MLFILFAWYLLFAVAAAVRVCFLCISICIFTGILVVASVLVHIIAFCMQLAAGASLLLL